MAALGTRNLQLATMFRRSKCNVAAIGLQPDVLSCRLIRGPCKVTATDMFRQSVPATRTRNAAAVRSFLGYRARWLLLRRTFRIAGVSPHKISRQHYESG